MRRPFLRIATFTVAFLAVYSYVVVVVSDIAGEKARVEKEKAALIGGAVEATPEAGEKIFWGKGACHTCHSIGGRGSAIRGPNLGETRPLGLPVGARAMKRAEERTKQTGKTYSPTDYFLESLMEPDVYLVEGFSKLMPIAWRPPIALKPDEIRAVVTYLQSLGGTVDLASIDQSPFFTQLQVLVAAGKAQASIAGTPKLLVSGDPQMGKEIFFSAESPAGCGKCHRVGDKGSNVGPELTNIAAAQPLDYLIESILDPNKVIVKGFEPIMIQTKGGQLVTGLIKKESAETIEIGDSQGQIQKISKSDIAERVPQKSSLMPGNFGDILTVKDFHDLLAFLQTLK
jgi:putative heme-binding domain-containing protein